MAGISFSGITQLFTAGTRPPHLAAIAPMSVTDDLYTATGFPGGIRNSGFAPSWIQERMDDARPAPGGRPALRAGARARGRQALPRQPGAAPADRRTRVAAAAPQPVPHAVAVRAALARRPWIDRIDVPTFLVGQFQDEQTGGHFAAASARCAATRRSGSRCRTACTPTRSGPSTITRWVEFLKLYVAGEVPRGARPRSSR